jgi:glycosyltransferase involved in cell wall biosynthesis
VPPKLTTSIVIPTRRRPDYLDVALASVMPQAASTGAEVLVVSDGIDAATAAVAKRHGAMLLTLQQRSGANAARNLGLQSATGDLIVFIDDDVEAPSGWLDAIVAGVAAAPDDEVFGGPIRARFDGGAPRSCGRDRVPITTLDSGGEDRDVPFVWSANMAIRRTARERLGTFNADIHGRGEEEEWEDRYVASGGRIRYLAKAGLDHRRTAADGTVRALARAEYRLGKSARRNDVRKRSAPPIHHELRTLAGCLWHTLRQRCAYGITMAAHTLGRLREALAELRS